MPEQQVNRHKPVTVIGGEHPFGTGLILTQKGEAYINHSENGHLVSTEDVGPEFNVGSPTGWNAGSRTKDGGPQIVVDVRGFPPIIYKWGEVIR